MKNEITQEYLKEILHYNKLTGLFRWKVDIYSGRNKKQKHVSIGDLAGTVNSKGYLRIGINHKSYLCQRLAWLYEYGEWPSNEVDHINHVRSDNRIDNLRNVAGLDNQKNVSKRKDNNSGFTGVSWNAKSSKWVAQMQVNKKKIHLGYFSSLEDAVCARKQANIEHSFHINHGE